MNSTTDSPSRPNFRPCNGCGRSIISSSGKCWDCDDLTHETYCFADADAVYRVIVKYGVVPRTAREIVQLRRVAALVAARVLAERFAVDAAFGVRCCNPNRPVPYFLASLRNNTKEVGIDLASLWNTRLQAVDRA